MRVLIGVPCPELLRTRFTEFLYKWTSGSEHLVSIAWESTPNRMDKSISLIIDAAKKWRPQWLVRLDADVIPELALDDLLHIAEQNYVDGFGVSGSPTITETGLKEWKPLIPETESSEARFEVEWVSGSLVFCHQKAYERLPVRGRFTDAHGRTQKFYIALQHPEATEDADFCQAVRQLGVKVCADPRLLVRHRRELYIPSFRSPMRAGEGIRVDLFDRPEAAT
jgi:hypothetical protein